MNPSIRIGGMVPLTTIDYPDQLSCVLFCQGCAWRCYYCHNPELIAPIGSSELPWAQVMEFLHKRQGLLQAVVFSGGEATLQPGLAAAMQEVKALGFKIGLHTAGIKPTALAKVLPLCDWVGFDIKAPQGQGDRITQIIGSDAVNWESLDLLLSSGLPYECRTTVHWALLNEQQLLQLGQQLQRRGVKNFVLQQARSGGLADDQLAPSAAPAQLNSLCQQLATMFDSFVCR